MGYTLRHRTFHVNILWHNLHLHETARFDLIVPDKIRLCARREQERIVCEGALQIRVHIRPRETEYFMTVHKRYCIFLWTPQIVWERYRFDFGVWFSAIEISTTGQGHWMSRWSCAALSSDVLGTERSWWTRTSDLVYSFTGFLNVDQFRHLCSIRWHILYSRLVCIWPGLGTYPTCRTDQHIEYQNDTNEYILSCKSSNVLDMYVQIVAP